MICFFAQLPELFAETPVPSGPISDRAAEAIARLLWAAVEGEGEADRGCADDQTGKEVQP